VTVLASVALCAGATAACAAHRDESAPAWLLEERFADGRLTDGLWDARLRMVTRKDIDPTQSGRALSGLDNLGGGYLHFWDSKGEEIPFLVSAARFDRRPGRCLAVAFCGTVHRGGPVNAQFSERATPEDRFSAGPGWAAGQFQGPSWMVNTAVPFDAGRRGAAWRNENVDTLFLTVLRKRGAFFLTSSEPDAAPPLARLCHVSHSGSGDAYHAALLGGRAHARFHAAGLLDLAGPWREEFGIATIVDRFDRGTAGRPDRGGTPWQRTGTWTLADGALTCRDGGVFLTDAGTRGAFVEVLASAGKDSARAGIVLGACGADNLLRFDLCREGARLVRRSAGTETHRWLSRDVRLEAGRTRRLAARLEGDDITVCVDDAAVGTGRVPRAWLQDHEPRGTRMGVAAEGAGAAFDTFVAWPLSVRLPPGVASLLPPVPVQADGDVVLHDDFEGDAGPMDGRRPAMGRGTWHVHRGTWRIEDGAAVLAESPGMVLMDCGHTDYEISTTIDMRGPPDFPGLYARVSGREAGGRIHARFLWQNASPEIEVWDRPAGTPQNRRRWAGEGGGIPTVLINATNISYGARPGSPDLPGRIRPGERHVLRLVVRGNRVSYFCDDVLVGTAPTRLRRGTWIGLGMSPNGNARCRWLDVTVRAFRDDRPSR
jgi:hypothetical protein